jgi:hypothetical protein
MRVLLLAMPLLAACGGSSAPGVQLTPPPEPVTRATLSGPLCSTDRCRCRAVDAPADGGAGVPEQEGLKRFELHVGPAPNPLWVTIGDMVLYKSDERAEDCFYVDLPAGRHPVTLRASRPHGFSAQLDIHEYGATSQSWYDTFSFSCGAPGTCSYDALDAWKASKLKYTRGLHDPCGSTKVRGIAWNAGRAPDQLHPEDLQLELTLEVYPFVPERPRGHAECRDNIGG